MKIQTNKVIKHPPVGGMLIAFSSFQYPPPPPPSFVFRPARPPLEEFFSIFGPTGEFCGCTIFEKKFTNFNFIQLFQKKFVNAISREPFDGVSYRLAGTISSVGPGTD